MNKALSLAAVATLAALTLTACGSDDSTTTDTGADVVEADTLTVCSDVPYPPFEDFDKESELGFTGFDIELMQAIADNLELELKVVDSAFDPLQNGQSLNSGQCDVAASAMTITEEREANLDFTDGYYNSQQSLLVPNGSDIESIDDLDGVKVAVQQGTTGKSYTEENAPDAEIVTFPGDAEMFQALQAEQVDAILQDLPVNLVHAEDGEFSVVETYDTDEEYGFAVKTGNSLADDINGALEDLRADGTYDEIYDSYFAID